MKDALTLYSELTDFREKFISDAVVNAIYYDIKVGTNQRIRPIVIIKSEEELFKLNSQIFKWQQYVEKIVQLDPVRFNYDSTKFTLPKILIGYEKLSIRVSDAISTRVISKKSILRRLQALITRESNLDTPDHVMIERLKKEYNDFFPMEEENFQIRSKSFVDVRALCKKIGAIKSEKYSVTMAGLFLFDPDNKLEIIRPDQSRQSTGRKDRFEMLNVSTVPCSLPFGGDLYKLSEVEAAKASRKQSEELKKQSNSLERNNEARAAKQQRIKDAVEHAASKLNPDFDVNYPKAEMFLNSNEDYKKTLSKEEIKQLSKEEKDRKEERAKKQRIQDALAHSDARITEITKKGIDEKLDLLDIAVNYTPPAEITEKINELDPVSRLNELKREAERQQKRIDKASQAVKTEHKKADRMRATYLNRVEKINEIQILIATLELDYINETNAGKTKPELLYITKALTTQRAKLGRLIKKLEEM